MTQHSAWVSYGGDARIELAVALVAAAGAAVYAGTRLRRPVRPVRPGRGTVTVMFLAWGIAIVGLLVGTSIYIQQYLRDNHLTKVTTTADPITPVTFLAVVAIFVIILTRGGLSFRARLGSAIIGALAAPWIFELPFDLIVMARTASLQPDPALYRALFFAPLCLVAITTLALLILSPMVRLTKATFFTFALMLLVFAVWALDGFGYPSTPAPIALNMVSKVLAFATALTLFLPPRLSQWRTTQPPDPDAEQVPRPARPQHRTRQPAAAVLAIPGGGAVIPMRVMAPPILDTAVRKETLMKASTAVRAAVPVSQASPGAPVIQVFGLRKSFGEKEAVAGIDLEITAGSFAGLVGPNGAGKTTSLSMMTGLLRPDGGRVLIHGIDVWADPPAAKAAIGVVPAEARLFDRLSGAELLEYAGRLRGLPAGEARSRAAQLLDVLDLTADAKRLVADYSTGMRKKAALGCALIHNPSVLFLDEPLEGVDPVSADAIRRLLTSFVGSGSTVLFSSHVMELVEQVCNHVSIISQGRIVATGTTEQVRGGQTLQRAFINLVGSHHSEEGLSWLGSSCS